MRGIQKLTRKKKHPDGIRGCGILDHPSLKTWRLDSNDRRMSLGIKLGTSNMVNWNRQGGRGRESSCVVAQPTRGVAWCGWQPVLSDVFQ